MNVPKLRFKEFNDEWSFIELSKISSDISYGMGLASKEYDGVNKYIRITDIDETTNKYSNKDIVSPDGVLEDKYLVNKNDILFARTGASTGKTYLYDEKDGKLYFAGFLIRANIINHDANFIFQQTKTNKYNKWVKIMSMRSGQPGINSQEYGSYKFSITSPEEEEKISKTLNLLDKKIELQTKKIEDLKLFKKGLDQSIFNNKTLFKQELFKNLFDSDGGTALEEYISKDGTHKIISIGNYSTNGLYIDNGQRITLNDKTKTKLLDKDNLVMILNDKTISGDIIGSTILIDKDNHYIYNQRSQKLICKNIDPKYAWCFLNSNTFRKRIFQLSQGGTQIYVNFPTIEKETINIPKDENISNLIINSIFSIYKKIELENDKLDKLQQLKKWAYAKYVCINPFLL